MKCKNKLMALAMTLMALPATVNAADPAYYQPISMEGVELVLPIKWGVISAIDGIYMVPGFYEATYANQFEPNKTSVDCPALVSGGACYNDGLIYSCEYDDSYRVQDQEPWWRVRKADTYELVSEHKLPNNFQATTTSLAYDRTTNKIYGFITTYTETFLVEIDPETGAMTKKTSSSYDWHYKYTTLACNKNGVLYCIYVEKESSRHFLGRVRKTDGRVAEIGEIVVKNLMSGDMFYDGTYTQCMFFNNQTDKLYWMFPSESANLYPYDYTPMFEIDIESTTATMIAYLQQHYQVSGAFFREPAFSAPSAPGALTYETDGELLSGQLAIEMPATTYAGDPISGNLVVTVMENGKVILQDTALPDETFLSDPIDLEIGNHTFDVYVTNEAGENSPTVKRNVYGGFDVPAACQNIVLTADGLTTTLTWDAPTEGLNGAPINPAGFTYTVYRYPNEVKVAEGLTERVFAETHPEDMTRYVYKVFAVDQYGRNGQAKYSNNLIVGTPLNPPYGGMFTDVADMLNYYTILDINKDGSTWTYDISRASAVYLYSVTNQANDWLISPPINYIAGHRYKLSFKAYSSLANYPESMEVRFGEGRTPESQYNLLLDIPMLDAPSEDTPVETYELEIVPATDGVKYYSFHAYSEPFCEYLYLFDIRLVDLDASVVDSMVADTKLNLTAVNAGNGNLVIVNPDRVDYAVYDLSGRRVAAGNSDAVHNLSAGVYIVNGEGRSQKVIVK